MEMFLQWLAGIGAAFKKPTEYFSRPRHPASDTARETLVLSASDEPGALAAATESATATPITTATFSAPVTADSKISHDVEVSCLVPIRPDQQEIQRRRELVRAMFNDFWSGRDDKPAAFVDRLDDAELYLNERLTACGEFWQSNARAARGLHICVARTFDPCVHGDRRQPSKEVRNGPARSTFRRLEGARRARLPTAAHRPGLLDTTRGVLVRGSFDELPSTHWGASGHQTNRKSFAVKGPSST
jgi:hypothetical protein